MALLASVLISALAAYVLLLFAASRRRPAVPEGAAPDGLFFVFLLPCLNEELVIRASLERLLAVRGDFAVLVIDDGSDDRTAEVVSSFDPTRVWLLRRVAPFARQGKGAALNAAYRHLLASDVLDGRSPDDVVLVILDADGRIEPNALQEVAPRFADPSVGGVQIGVRMYNAGTSVLTRLQDVEFVTFTGIFQKARARAGIAGLGGNGQFNRLSALATLGDDPWSACLTEDLELGLRLLIGGWRNEFCATTWVNQQAVTDVRRLVRQRARWFQGHLQCWRQVMPVLRSDVPLGLSADLVHHLLSPMLVLLMSVSGLLFLASTALGFATAPEASFHLLVGQSGIRLAIAYWMAFGLAVPYAYVYRQTDPGTGFLRAFGLAHVFALYSYLWIPAGWLAVGRLAMKREGWQKTTRTAAAPTDATIPADALAGGPQQVAA